MMLFRTVIMLGVGVLFFGCSHKAPSGLNKESQSNTTPACQVAQLKPVMSCGEYVIVKGRINSSNNLERSNETTMYMGGIKNADSNTLLNKTVLLSGKCSSEMIAGSSTMIYLNNVQLMQTFDGKEIDKDKVKEVCNKLKRK